ncbi:unnamed protein product [Effrenium voratum]|nr:unnamed protein product [Effrenium voratum]
MRHAGSASSGGRPRRGDSDLSAYEESSASHATKRSSRRQSRERRSIGNLFPLTGAGTAKHMLHVAQRISKEVNQLYTTRAEREQAAEQNQGEQDEQGSHTDDDGLPMLIEPLEEGSEKTSSNSSSDSEQSKALELDSELEDYDHEAAGERIASMLEKMKCQDRTEIMEGLHGFYQLHLENVETALEELEVIEKDYHGREDETKDSMNNMVRAFEAKGMSEVQVLVKCSATLQAGANGTWRERQRFSRAQKRRAQLQEERARAQALSEQQAEQEKAEEALQEKEEGKDLEPKPKRKLKPIFFDEVKPEEEVEEEPDEEVPVHSILDEEIKEADVWDLNRARELWSKMNEKASKVAGGRGSAIEILQAMVVVQEGNAELQRRSELAKKAIGTLSAAIEFLARQGANGLDMDPEPGEEATVEYAKSLRERLLSQVDMEELEEALDPEELEEECADLERILGEQEHDIEVFYRQRQEKAASNEEEQVAKLERSLEDEPGERGATEEKKSTFMDARLEGIKIQGDDTPTAAQRMKQAAKTAAALSSLKKTGSSSSAVKLHSAEDFKDDPKVKMLREHISTKDGQIHQAQKLLRRMRYERRLLKYCQRKAKAGFDDIVKEFKPPTFEEFDSGAESVDSAAEEEAKQEEAQEQERQQETKQETSQEAKQEEAAEGKDEATPEATADSKPEPKVEPKPESDGHKEEAKPPEKKGPAMPSLAAKIFQKSSQNNQGKEAEIALKQEVERLQEDLTKQATDLREEKAKQKLIRKEIKDLRKEFHTLGDKHTPKTLEGLEEQIQKEEAKHADMQREIHDLKTLLGLAPQAQEPPEPEAQAEAKRREGEPEDAPEVLPEGLKVDGEDAASHTSDPAAPSASSPAGTPGSGKSPTSFMGDSRTEPGVINEVAGPDSTGEGQETGQAASRTASKATAPGSNNSTPSNKRSSPTPLKTEAVEAEKQEEASRPSRTSHTAPTPLSPTSPTSPAIPASPRDGGAEPGEETDEASATVVQLIRTQTKTEEMRDEIHDIDAKLKKLKTLMKSKGGDADQVVTSVREILGVHHEEEVKAPAEYLQMKKELKEQQEKVRALRKRWWDDHRDFDGLVEKVRNQMGGLRHLFSGEGKMPTLEEASQTAGPGTRFSMSDSPSGREASQPRGRVRGSVASQRRQTSKDDPQQPLPARGRRLSGLVGFGAFNAMNQGPVKTEESPRTRFSYIKTQTQTEQEKVKERRTLHSLFG